MDTIGALLGFLAAPLVLILGLIRPAIVLPWANPPSRVKVAGLAGTIFMMGLAIIVGDAAGRAPPREQQQRPAQIPLPAAEAAFVAAIVEGKAAYRAAPNDMAKGATRQDRNRAICSALSSLIVNNWRGKIYKMSSNSDGKGVLELAIGPNVYLKTWNNAFSDLVDYTLIDPSSPVGRAAIALSIGQSVIFSGEFIVDSGQGCVREASLTLAGSMTEPEFIFRFSAIVPAR
jgi:hypothetical protein